MKIKVFVSTNKVGSRCESEIEIDDSELEGYEGSEREEFITESCRDAMFEMIEWGYEEAEFEPPIKFEN